MIFIKAWWLCIPILGGGIYIFAMHKNIAKRMADMTGYTKNEKLNTIIASLLPYPFIATTIWSDITAKSIILYMGAIIYVMGLVLYILTIRIFLITPINEIFHGGPFHISRNPMYVSATLMFIGICIMTNNIMLIAILIVMIIFQHFMILAEERICTIKYGDKFRKYMNEAPRYLFKI
jgi:protein-S-isoprenylcysteine O-methyltransferase Ste14